MDWYGKITLCSQSGHVLQVEIDYKSECMAGQTVESLGSHIAEDTNGSGILR